jgi:hypothetical protein
MPVTRRRQHRWPRTDTHHQTPKAAGAQTSAGSGRNLDESGLTANQRVVPPSARQGRQADPKRVMAPDRKAVKLPSTKRRYAYGAVILTALSQPAARPS